MAQSGDDSPWLKPGASTVFHRCCVAPQPVDCFRSTPERWNALLWLCERAPCPRHVHAFTRGNALPRNAQTRLSWQGAAELFSPLCKKPASENAIHPLAQAKGLSGGEAVRSLCAAPQPLRSVRSETRCSAGVPHPDDSSAWRSEVFPPGRDWTFPTPLVRIRVAALRHAQSHYAVGTSPASSRRWIAYTARV